MFAPYTAPLIIPLFILATPVIVIHTFFQTLAEIVRMARIY